MSCLLILLIFCCSIHANENDSFILGKVGINYPFLLNENKGFHIDGLASVSFHMGNYSIKFDHNQTIFPYHFKSGYEYLIDSRGTLIKNSQKNLLLGYSLPYNNLISSDSHLILYTGICYFTETRRGLTTGYETYQKIQNITYGLPVEVFWTRYNNKLPIPLFTGISLFANFNKYDTFYGIGISLGLKVNFL